MIKKIKVYIYDQKEYEQHKNYYKDHQVLEICYGNIFNDRSDAFVTAGNSYGMCDGGIDGHMNYFFDYIEKRIQNAILQEWHGELPVGVSMLFPTPENRNFRYLCYAPTMKVPHPVPYSINAYLAMRGALVACSKNEDIETIAVPLLCHGVGEMPVTKILQQIQHAYDTFVNPVQRHWKEICISHMKI